MYVPTVLDQHKRARTWISHISCRLGFITWNQSRSLGERSIQCNNIIIRQICMCTNNTPLCRWNHNDDSTFDTSLSSLGAGNRQNRLDNMVYSRYSARDT